MDSFDHEIFLRIGLFNEKLTKLGDNPNDQQYLELVKIIRREMSGSKARELMLRKGIENYGLEFIKHLVSNGVLKIDSNDPESKILREEACNRVFTGDIESVEYLLPLFDNPIHANQALNLAIRKGELKIIELLLPFSKIENDNYYFCYKVLEKAVDEKNAKGFKEIFERLLDYIDWEEFNSSIENNFKFAFSFNHHKKTLEYWKRYYLKEKIIENTKDSFDKKSDKSRKLM